MMKLTLPEIIYVCAIAFIVYVVISILWDCRNINDLED